MNMKRKYTSLPFTEYPVAVGHFDTLRETIDMIVLHSSASNKQGLINTFGGGTRMVSAHYGIDNDGSILAFLEEYNTAYHAGNLAVNRKSIGIEHIDNGADVRLHTDAQYETSAKLVADICTFYNIPIDEAHIIPHSQVKATACPNGLDVSRIINSAKKLAGTTDMNDQDKKDIESMKNLRAYNNVWYESKNVIADYEARRQEIKELQDALGVKHKEISNLKADVIAKDKEIAALKKEVETVQNKAVADLAKKDIDCQKKIDDVKSHFIIDTDSLKKKHAEEIKKLKESAQTTPAPIETPLKDRFAKKSKLIKFNAILEIISA